MAGHTEAGGSCKVARPACPLLYSRHGSPSARPWPTPRPNLTSAIATNTERWMFLGLPNYSPRPGPLIWGNPRAPHAQEAWRTQAQQPLLPPHSPSAHSCPCLLFPPLAPPGCPTWSCLLAIWVPSLPRHPTWPLHILEQPQSICSSEPVAASPRSPASSDASRRSSRFTTCLKQVLCMTVWAQADARMALGCSRTTDALVQHLSYPLSTHRGEDGPASAPM